MTVSKSSIMDTLDLGESIHSSRHLNQRPVESAAEDSHQEPPNSYGDFLPSLNLNLNIHVVSHSIDRGNQTCGVIAAASAAEIPVDVVSSVGTPLTPATLAALPESCCSRLDRWIEAVQYNNRIAIEGARVPAGDDDDVPLAGADELIAVGEWCPDDLREYPGALRPEDVLAEEDDLSDWVEITKDEV